ncbi:MAG TPA: hypothetical protein VEK77_07025 [Gemmatimonadales bacterium]|nr:hypothetical protein [Gemmatimonadales bacterium]
MEFDLQRSVDVLERTPATLRALLLAVGTGWARGTDPGGAPALASALPIVYS